MGKREPPLAIAITTAGVGRNGIAWELYAYAKRVAAGEVEDPTFLPVLLEPPEGFDWRDPEVWAYVNPALGVFRVPRGDADLAPSAPSTCRRSRPPSGSST